MYDINLGNPATRWSIQFGSTLQLLSIIPSRISCATLGTEICCDAAGSDARHWYQWFSLFVRFNLIIGLTLFDQKFPDMQVASNRIGRPLVETGAANAGAAPSRHRSDADTQSTCSSCITLRP